MAGMGGDPIATVTELVHQAEEITVLTGAGISTDSGIPDFRGPSGVWTRDPGAARVLNLHDYLSDPDVRRLSWQRRLEHPVWTAEPNAAHRALVDLEQSGRLRTIITQNIDGLHQRAGSDPALVLEVHGTMHSVVCMGCADRTPMSEALARVEAGEADPACLRCGNILKSATIFFGQQLDEAVFRSAAWAASDCDLLLAIGTSLTVEPVAGLVGVAAEAGAPVVVLNAEPTPYDEVATAVLRNPIGTVLPEILAGARRPGLAAQ